MIPLHDLRWEHLPAIGAWPAALEAQEPLRATPFPIAGWHARATDPLVPVVIDHRSARFAVGLHPIASAVMDVKLGERFRLAAPRATFHLDSPSVRYQHRYRQGLARRSAPGFGSGTMPL